MPDFLLFAAGCLIFAITTVTTLLYGYMRFNSMCINDQDQVVGVGSPDRSQPNEGNTQ